MPFIDSMNADLLRTPEKEDSPRKAISICQIFRQRPAGDITPKVRFPDPPTKTNRSKRFTRPSNINIIHATLELNVYGVLTDKAGKQVYFHSTGVAGPSTDGTLPLAENIYMHSNHPDYAWMNTRQFWANGVVDPKDMSLKVYVFGA